MRQLELCPRSVPGALDGGDAVLLPDRLFLAADVPARRYEPFVCGSKPIGQKKVNDSDRGAVFFGAAGFLAGLFFAMTISAPSDEAVEIIGAAVEAIDLVLQVEGGSS